MLALLISSLCRKTKTADTGAKIVNKGTNIKCRAGIKIDTTAKVKKMAKNLKERSTLC